MRLSGNAVVRPRLSSTARLQLRDSRVAIVASQFHEALCNALIAGARSELTRLGMTAKQIQVVTVPGAFELPAAAARIARGPEPPDAIIAVGVVIRGETSQYHIIAQAAAQGLTAVSVQTGVPVTFGVVVAETLAQAKARAVRGPHNRGAEAARAALAMLRHSS